MDNEFKYNLDELKICPQCGNEMRPDLLLYDGRGIKSSPAQFDPEQIAGYGYFCKGCERGWTGDTLPEIRRTRKGKKPLKQWKLI